MKRLKTRSASKMTFPAKYVLVIIFACCLPAMPGWIGAAAAAGAAPISGPFGIDSSEVAKARGSQWNIEAQTMSYDQEHNRYEAEGKVRISSEDRLIEADRAELDMEERRAELWGNVYLKFGKNWIKGQHVIWSLDSETGWVDEGITFFDENKFFVSGRNITKTGPNQFNLQEGFVTSCEPTHPDWQIRYDSMKVDVGGYAVGKNISMWAGPVPVMFLPAAWLPVKRERESGFLLPWAGYSDLLGFDFEIPYYWAFRDDMDATFYARYMSERGFMGGVEYRVNNPTWGEGVWMFNFLRDGASKDFLADKGYPFETQDRYWVRSRHNIELPWQIDAKIDLDIVSDRNFLQEFYTGSTSFPHSSTEFLGRFGRGILLDYTSLVRESVIYLEKRRESDLLSMDIRYFQQLLDTAEKSTIQKLPGFSYTLLPTWIGNTDLYFTVDASAVDYVRREGDEDQRIDLNPQVFYPMHWAKYINVEPSVGMRSTSYLVEWDSKSFETFNQRAVFDTKIEANSRLNRVYQVDWGNTVALQHTVRPEIAYEYATQQVYGHIPTLDQIDLDRSRNGVRYGFTTFLTSKSVANDASGNPFATYRELARLRAYQFYNLEKPAFEDPLFNGRVLDEGFSPVAIRLDLTPLKYITLSYDADYDFRSPGDANSQDVYLTFNSGTGHSLRVDYQRRNDIGVNEVITSASVKALKNIYLNAYYDVYLDQGTLYQQGYGIKYTRGCWGIGLAYERVGGDNRVTVTVDLLGIGTLGRAFGSSAMSPTATGFQ